MKKVKIISKTGLMCLWVLLLVYETARAQNPCTGMWEGNFMDQFKTVILLDQTDESTYAGKIIMFSGENRIQDDELSKIIIDSQNLSFYIAAKETYYEGSYNEDHTELAGNFIFPDKSKHPLTVRKFEKDSTVSETETPGLKEKLDLRFPAEELKSEFKELIEKLKKYHPRLYSYTPESSFMEEAEDILSDMKTELSMEEYYLRIAPLIASVECSHTGIRIPRDYQKALFEYGHFFPLEIYVSDLRAYVFSTPEVPGVDLQPGSEILRINHRAVGEIINDLLAIIPSEGNCLSTKYQELNRDFQSYFHLLDPSEKFLVETGSADQRSSLELNAVPYSTLNRKPDTQTTSRPYSFQIHHDPEIGVLEVSSFGIGNMEDYFAFLDSTFRLMKDMPNLMLDLRGNQGGHPIFAAQLFSYLCEDEFTYFQRNPDVEEFEPLYNKMEPNSLHFTGNIYVLVNGACLSSTGHLISLLKYHTDARFIGEEPGSSYLCNDFSIQFQLSCTGMEVNIPRTTFVTAVSGFEEDIPFPLDYKVDVTVQDLLDGTDTYKSYIYELLNKEADENNQLGGF